MLKRFAGLVVVLLTVLSMTAFAQDKPTIELGYVLWDSEIASTNVVGAIIEDELGYDVELTAVDAGPMWIGIANGDFDAIVAAWLPATHAAYYERTQDDIVDLGPNLNGAKIGLVVPSYVTIGSIPELNEHRDQFGGQIVGIDPGAGLMAATEEAIDVYDLDYSLLEGSGAAMTAALQRAINDEEWIVVTGWTPHWKFAQFDLKYLEDPEGVYGGEESIHTIVTPELESKAPDVYAFLDNFHWTPDQMGEVMLMIQNGMDPAEAARAWIADNQDVVQSWLE